MLFLTLLEFNQRFLKLNYIFDFKYHVHFSKSWIAVDRLGFDFSHLVEVVHRKIWWKTISSLMSTISRSLFKKLVNSVFVLIWRCEVMQILNDFPGIQIGYCYGAVLTQTDQMASVFKQVRVFWEGWSMVVHLLLMLWRLDSPTWLIGYKQLSYCALMVRIDQYNWLDFLIGLLEHRHHENSAVGGSQNEAGMILGGVNHMVCDFLIWKEKLELMLVVYVLNN